MRLFILTIVLASLAACGSGPSNKANTNATNNNAAANKPKQTGPAPVYGYEVVKAYPHDPKAFTEGLFFHDGYLYESTGQERHSTLRKV